MQAIEWAPYIIKEGVTQSTVIEKANAVQHDYIAKQPGFLRRTLICKSEREYADVLYWKSKSDAHAASEKIMEHDVCQQYFDVMDHSVTVSSGFSHYDVLKDWSK